MASSRAVINIGHGSWYPKGTERLKKYMVGCKYDVQFTSKLAKGIPNHLEYPYYLKIDYINQMRRKYSGLLWLDCSLVPYQNINVIIDYIENHPFTIKHGFYAYKTGFSIGQSCNDNAIISSRVMDLNLPEFATTMFYISDYTLWECATKLVDLGALRGDRERNPKESKRKEFLFHRQDQSVISLAAHMCRVDHTIADNLGDIVQYNYKDITPDRTKLFLVAGGYGDNLAELNFKI
jgi:hypothetical protein